MVSGPWCRLIKLQRRIQEISDVLWNKTDWSELLLHPKLQLRSFSPPDLNKYDTAAYNEKRLWMKVKSCMSPCAAQPANCHLGALALVTMRMYKYWDGTDSSAGFLDSSTY